jgi:hypothetical protein
MDATLYLALANARESGPSKPEATRSTTMRFNLEQFLALTLALGTAGAIGAAVYTSRSGSDDDADQADPDERAKDEPFPEADDDPAPTPAPKAAPVATPPPPVKPMPALDSPPEVLDDVPGPEVESMSW